MRIPPRLLGATLITSGITTLVAISVNVMTSETVPPPFDVIKPFAIWVTVGLWLVSALLLVAQDLPRLRAERLTAALDEPNRVNQAIEMVRGRSAIDFRARLHGSRLFPELRLPQFWRSAGASRPGTWLATSPSGATRERDYVHAFEAVPSGRLVVCGTAGSGKTDWLLTYALGALDSGGPVPLVLDLSQWSRGVSFAEWASRQVGRVFPELDVTTGSDPLGMRLIVALLRSNRFVLLLDGFDEVAPERRSGLLGELNSGLWLKQAVIMTSRTDAYPDHGLRDAAVITLEPLTPDAIGAWLDTVFPSAADKQRWHPVRVALRDADGPVATSLSTPLMATLAAKVFEAPASRPAELADPLRHPTAESITSRLLSGLVPAAYQRPGDRPKWTDVQAAGWLEFLATHTGRDGVAWWRLFQLVPRWRFAVTFGLLVGLVAAVVADYLSWAFLGPLPPDPPEYTTGDFFQQPLLILQSWFENSVRALNGIQAPSAAETAVTIGSALGAVTAGWLAGALLGPRDRVAWGSGAVKRSRKDIARDVCSGTLLSAAAGGALGALSAAVASSVFPFGDGSSALFWLALGIGAKAGAVTGAITGLYSGGGGEPPLPWYHLSPVAPGALRLAFPPLRRVIGLVLGGALAGGMLALTFERAPGQAALGGAAIGLALVIWYVADEATEHHGPGPADEWRATGSERPVNLLRDDLRASIVRVLAAAVLGVPLLAPQIAPIHPDIARGLFALWLFVAVLRELALRSWSWWLVATAVLALRKRLPLALLRFLDDARERHVLRLEGGLYHFRHGELADWLSRTAPAPAPRPEPPEEPSGRDAWESSEVDGDPEPTTGGKGELARLKRLLRDQLTRLGPSHRDVVVTRLRLAHLLTGKRALGHIDAILAARPERLPREDPLLVRTHLRAAELHERGDHVAALHHAAMAEAGLPPGDPRAAEAKGRQVWSNLGAITDFAPWDRQLAELAELHDRARTELGADDPVTVYVRAKLAVACGRASRWAEAEEHLLAVTEWAAEHLPPGDREAARYRKLLSRARRRRRF
ncbi:hypothetical protein NLX83_28420 [Allokutzneria sp. A3M-2-11 16]|uniref:NACHT domain-containing protein n=1 Tax=Allokutzneria sp. A3M-2-11 16 TaxID=2962043 RepID=UPI0020B7D6E6|nr:hypothetical protein [Allokutzneria sp. A3M-2-11 16]MCP3803209.1 hypothetical protein [Allokutzneria sp. A3M-2-11 16]